jgi:hypothetical protein
MANLGRAFFSRPFLIPSLPSLIIYVSATMINEAGFSQIFNPNSFDHLLASKGVG